MPLTLVPFAGLRYNPSAVPDLSMVMTPPYDVIGAEQRQGYLAAHAYNMIHLILGAEYATDRDQENRFTRAAALLRQWRRDGVLIREAQPALYLYQQDFMVDTTPMRRRGFISRVRLEDYQTQVIFPHEATLAGPKAELLRLWQACQANLSPVLALYLDAAHTLDAVFAPVVAQPPQRDVAHWGEGRHRLWVVTDPAVIASVQQCMRAKSLVIADGHHRYETALALRDRMRQQYPQAGTTAAYEYVMMYCANVYDPGLVVFPTHRLVQHLPLPEMETALQPLRDWVHVAVEPRHTQSLEQWQQRLAVRLRAHQGPDSIFALYAGGDRCYVLTVSAAVARQRVSASAASDAWKQLDVSVLHHALLPALQALVPGSQPTVTYAGVGDEVLPAVARGACDLAVMMRPTSLEQMVGVAMGGERMPPKSTFFYPKLPTGLVINGFDT
jgi:uncharacterized protein (DUF1015 family)